MAIARMARIAGLLAVALLAVVVSLAAGRGVVRVALATSYGPDVATAGQATSCGTFSGYTDDNAFDDSLSTSWFSSQSGASVNYTACIGQDFGSGVAYHIRRMVIKQALTSSNRVSSALVQNSSNGTSWNTSETLTLPDDGDPHTYFLAASGAYRYWRLLANSAAVGTWGNVEIEMNEVLVWSTETPYPSATPTITLTPTSTATPTPTNTPDYFIIATFQVTQLAGYPISVKPTASYGDISVVAIGGVVAGLLFVSLLVALSWNRNIGVRPS